jgi:hypothetical protein
VLVPLVRYGDIVMSKTPLDSDPSPGGSPALQSQSPRGGPAFKICVVILGLGLVAILSLVRIYGIDTCHATRSGIWWPERGRSLIPPTAKDITLRRDLLDHYAIYTVSEKDLNTFLNQRFARPGEVLDSYSERVRIKPDFIGKAIGPMGWLATTNTVSYYYTASNGGSHRYFHDTETGRTFQSSAYW